MPTLILIDPNDKLRAAAKRHFKNSPGWRVVGDYASTKTALACAVAEQPAVVVIDINLPSTNSLDRLHRIYGRLCINHASALTAL